MRVQLSATLTLLSLTLNTVSSVGLFVLEGSPVTLNTTQHDETEDILYITWMYNQTEKVVYYVPTPQVRVGDLFKGRVEFNRTDFSLTLKNPQMNDSGLYTAVVETMGKPSETACELSVLAPVVAPTLTVVSNWSSSDSCNVTLKCTGLNVSLISICNSTFCSQEGGDRFLSIAFNRTTVSCNHSNPVSWKPDSIALEPLCPLYTRISDNTTHNGSSLSTGTGIGIGIIVIGCVSVIGLIVYMQKRRKEGEAQIVPNTQDPLPTSGGDNHYEAPTSQAKSNAAPAPTVYDVVQFNRHTDSSSTESAPVMSSSPETIYAVVKKKDGPN